MQRSDNFKRLPARRWGAIRRASLWDAGEYLLSVSGTSFHERYRRFYYRDIQSIVVQRGPRLGSISALIFFCFITTIFVLLAVAPRAFTVFHWLWIAPLAWLVWMIYANLARSCRVFLYTAVSNEELPAVYRRAAVGRVLPGILSKIREAQGSLDDVRPEAIAESTTLVDSGPAPAQTEPLLIPRTALYSALIFFSLLLGSTAFAYWYRDAFLTPGLLRFAKAMAYLLNALQVASGVLALTRLFRIRLLTAVRALIFAGLGLLALRSYALLLAQVDLQVRKGLLEETMFDVNIRHWIGTADGALSLLIAVIGLISLTMSWQDDRRGSTSNL